MKSRKATILWILFVLLTASIFISMRNPSADPQLLRIGYSPYSVNLVTFVAHEESFLKEAGFSVQLVPFQSTDALASALVNAEVDVASALTAEAVYSLNQREPESLQPFFFNIFTATNRVDAIVALKKDSTIAAPSDLRQVRIAVLPANMMKLAFARYLESNGIAAKEVEIVTLPPASILSAIGSGDVKAAYVLEPMVSVAEAKLNAKVVDSGIAAKAIADPLPAGFHSIRKGWLTQNPKHVKALIAAFRKAAARISSSPNEMRQHLAKYAGIDPALVSHVRLPDWAPFSKSLANPLRKQFDVLAPSQQWSADVFDKTDYLE